MKHIALSFGEAEVESKPAAYINIAIVGITDETMSAFLWDSALVKRCESA